MSRTLAAPPMFFDTTKPNYTTTISIRPAYWKLIPYASLPRPQGTASALKIRLRALGVYVKISATAKRCEKLLHRFERGLLAYEDLSTSQLTIFAHDRGLPCQPEANQHTQLVKLLEKADDEQKFEKFLDLPAELRLMVYEFHLGSLEVPTWGNRVRPPPLCRVSSLLREEAMPLFKEKEKKA
ncbi:uncharacterized protein RCC_03229 [Ramularia collo-cygni]|uniref:Uncharacterized protein n=1 Tax=Ramularia collo-cygni TaxID=112498 RepID=A0A2D3UTV7_9PEZI|nr:uncharacterized protein RCC_03229 [Ramularia collo-cygni]CZT17395.1 uncharacterized protein RCC_03229 [Ramularia collo-cygni]